MSYVGQSTLQYVTFIKRALVESLRDAFQGHPAKAVANSFVGVDFAHTKFQLPAVIIKYYERDIPNIGVGHVEYLPSPTDPNPDNPSEFIKYYHRMYKGDISFEVWGMSSPDRDILRDALIEVLSMTDATNEGYAFINRLYNALNSTPYGLWHFPVLNLDKITGYGENQQIAPWQPEDMLVYTASYRVPIFGEFYSNTPTFPSGTGLLQEVDVYPWIQNIDPPPAQADADDWYRFTGWLGGTEVI